MIKEYLLLYKENIGKFRIKTRTGFVTVESHKAESAKKKAQKILPDNAWLLSGEIYVKYKKREV